MATRYYPTRRSPGALVDGLQRGDWDPVAGNPVTHGLKQERYVLSQSKTNGGTNRAREATPGNTTDDYSLRILAFVTDPLDAQAVSGTVNCCLAVSRPTTGAVEVFHLHIYLTKGNSSEVRHTLLDNFIDSGAWNSTLTFRQLASGAQTLLAGNAQAGDRMIVEVGVRFTTGASGSSGTLRYGVADASGVGLTDGVVGGTNGTTRAGFFDFSHTFVELPAPAPPVNDAAADATLITALPFAAGPYDTTQSADTNRAVWYKWVADQATRVFFTTWGGNYATEMRVRQDDPTIGTTVALDGHDQYTQTSQTVVSWVPNVGRTYYIRIDSRNDDGTARNSGGALQVSMFRYQAPETGDLYVNGQHIVAYRGSTPLNVKSSFFGDTPSGLGIDYTLRPVPDLNGGTHSGLRLLVGRFGTVDPLVDLLDLLTLDVGDANAQTNFILDALQAGGQHIASLIFDQAGNILLGFYGENYSPLGELSPQISINPIRVNATDTDDPGGFPVGQTFAVAPDVGGSDFIDLALDQRTLFYTSAGRQVKRYDLTADSQLADFAEVPVFTNLRPGLRGLRLLPPGDGSAGLLVCAGDRVYRLNASGVIVQTYIPTPTDRAQDLHKIELTPDAQSFWVGDELSMDMWRFDLSSGAALDHFATELPPGQLCGMIVYNGFRAATSPLTPPPAPPLPDGCPPNNLEPRPVTGLDGCPISL